MKNEKYIFFHKTANTENLVRDVQNQLDIDFGNAKCIKVEDVPLLKNKLAQILATQKFQELKHKVANDVANLLGWSTSETLIQTRPTTRIFVPKAHSTSLHCDFWYGHARTAYTIWIPLTRLALGNSFWICDEFKNKLKLDELESRPLTAKDLQYDPEDGFEVHPPYFGAAVFNSRALHASPENTSDITRISFDFRIYNQNDKTCTKERELFYNSDEFPTQNNNDQDPKKTRYRSYLKYIIGGQGASTKSQHIIIDSYARENHLNIVAQEAEIERFDFPMLRMYLNSELGRGKIDGIIMASETMISAELKEAMKSSLLPVICVLEGKKYERQTLENAPH